MKTNATSHRHTAALTTEALSHRCTKLVEKITEATGEDWTFGYIGNCDHGYDDRGWYAFRPHPDRIGTHKDRIGGHTTDQLDGLVQVLSGALQMARMLKGV